MKKAANFDVGLPPLFFDTNAAAVDNLGCGSSDF